MLPCWTFNLSFESLSEQVPQFQIETYIHLDIFANPQLVIHCRCGYTFARDGLPLVGLQTCPTSRAELAPQQLSEQFGLRLHQQML